MNFITKRILEAAVVTTVLLIVIVHQNQKRSAAQFQAESIERFRILNQALWDKFGPGHKEGYFKITDT